MKISNEFLTVACKTIMVVTAVIAVQQEKFEHAIVALTVFALIETVASVCRIGGKLIQSAVSKKAAQAG